MGKQYYKKNLNDLESRLCDYENAIRSGVTTMPECEMCDITGDDEDYNNCDKCVLGKMGKSGLGTNCMTPTREKIWEDDIEDSGHPDDPDNNICDPNHPEYIDPHKNTIELLEDRRNEILNYLKKIGLIKCHK